MLLRKYKKSSNLSNGDICKKLNITKNVVNHWFAAENKYFIIPRAEKWEELKILLNIPASEYDSQITSFEIKSSLPHEDTLLCSRPHCKCVGSDLSLVEKRILDSLKTIKKEFQIYISDYEETIKKEETDNILLRQVIEKEIAKVNKQKEKACELVETGAYSQNLFVQRIKTLDEQLNNLIKQKNEIFSEKDNIKKFNSRQKAIPIIEDVLSRYSDDMTATEKNELLSTIIKKVLYTKDTGGRKLKDNFKLEIILNFFE